jgi:hypothetical protein
VLRRKTLASVLIAVLTAFLVFPNGPGGGESTRPETRSHSTFCTATAPPASAFGGQEHDRSAGKCPDGSTRTRLSPPVVVQPRFASPHFIRPTLTFGRLPLSPRPPPLT